MHEDPLLEIALAEEDITDQARDWLREVILSDDLSIESKLAAIIMARHVDENGVCSISDAQLAAEMNGFIGAAMRATS